MDYVLTTDSKGKIRVVPAMEKYLGFDDGHVEKYLGIDLQQKREKLKYVRNPRRVRYDKVE